MPSYPKVQSVEPLPGKRLRVGFSTGATKIYDCGPLLNDPTFAPLKEDWFFRAVHADRTGYGVVWNERLDLSEAELWLHGATEPSDSPGSE